MTGALFIWTRAKHWATVNFAFFDMVDVLNKQQEQDLFNTQWA
jgi:hypothetical protein